MERPESSVRPSDLIIGAAALIPAALKVGREVKRRIENDRRDRAA
jgi:hypothetical protein